MKLSRTTVLLLAFLVTMLFALKANTPAFAKVPVKADAPVCGGHNLMTRLRKRDPAAHAALLAREKQVVNGRGLFWKVEREGKAPSWLFGTMHMSDKRLTTLPADVADALKKARTVALELDETVLDEGRMQQEVMKSIALIAFLDGRTLDKILSPREIASLKTVLEKYGMPYATSRIMKPWFVSISIALPMCEVARQKAGFKALDAEIATASLERGTKLVGLETVKEQFAAFAALPMDSQKDFLISSLRMNHLLEDQIETMKQLYLEGRTAAIWELAVHLSREFATPEENNKAIEALAQFESKLISSRNKIMAKRAKPLLDKGNLFIGVGALHLPGRTGLVALLRKAGYKVTKVH